MTQLQPTALLDWPNEAKGRADPSRDRFRHNLARIMAEQHITQASLARTMDVSRVAVHAWIWGTCFPETSRLIKLAQALNVQVGALLQGDDAGPPNHGPIDMPLDDAAEEALLLNAFRKLPISARLTLIADAHQLGVQFANAESNGQTGGSDFPAEAPLQARSASPS